MNILGAWNRFRAREEERDRRGSFTRGALGLFGSVILSAVVVSSIPAALGAGWTAPEILGAPKASWVAIAGANRKGDAVAAWLQTDTVPYKVFASYRKAGAVKWARGAAISGISTSNPYPLMARIDRLRNIFVVWEDQGVVYGLVRPAGATSWPPAQRIASSVSLAGLAVDQSGNATLLVGAAGAVKLSDRPTGGTLGRSSDNRELDLHPRLIG